MDREAFLSRVRAATSTTTLPKRETPPPAPPENGGDLLAAFVRNLRAVDGTVHEPAQVSDVAPLALALLQGAGVRTFLSWDSEHLPVHDVVRTLTKAGMARIDATVPKDARQRRDHQARYADVDAGVTGASAGFAVSGSVVLTADAGRPRMASLIPPLHLALLPRSAIHHTVSSWTVAHPDAAASTSNLIFITGPSRTGDIEMRLNLGVHGPRSIHVVVVPDA